MRELLDPTQRTTCMKCRAAPARYHGKWAEEGLCRPCVQAMRPDIRVKVLRDMHPEDRRRWQLDGLLAGGDAPRRGAGAASEEATERDVADALRTVERGSEAEVGAQAERLGARALTSASRAAPPAGARKV